MGSFPKTFNELVKSFSCFPGVGRRSAERMVFHVLKMKSEDVKELSSKIDEIHKFIKPCKLCNNFSTKDICSICSDPKRDNDTLCIVEEPKDIMAIEKTAHFRGLYYVLLGAISPIEGISQDDLSIKKLLDRVSKGTIKEIVISTDPDNEGELTAQFLIQKLSPYKVKIFRLAIGIPLGTQIEYVDSATLTKALLERKPIT